MLILFEDEHLVVCRKERGVLSQQDSKGGRNMIELIKQECKSNAYPVHRLDKDVGGVMVYAKTQKAAAELSKQVADRTFLKQYLAIIHSAPEEEKGTMEDLLFFDKSKNKSFVVKKERRGVKKALLEYECIEAAGEKTLVKVKLHTGRTHQIRVQFASRKSPLYGDRRYGARDEEKTIALWSCRLEFNHPVTSERMSFELLPDNDSAFIDFYKRKTESPCGTIGRE